ncbi:MAG: Tat pathway signal protein [Bacteroidetes bacterium]|nr:MAG: Tat pathway signal protein [Bacteroidota bacterium]
MSKNLLLLLLLCLSLLPACEQRQKPADPEAENKTFSLEELQRRNFMYFYDLAHPETGLIPDRWPAESFSSIAACGFGLTSYIVGVENKWITRASAAERSHKMLKFLWELPQGEGKTGIAGYKGLFYHFLNMNDGIRFKDVELSNIDTGLLMAGVLSSQVYFDGKDSTETQIRALADSLYRRVEWGYNLQPDNLLCMGWSPERGFISNKWSGYNEGMILYILALGSPTHPLPAASWEQWCKTYVWAPFEGQPEHVNFGMLFGHQYSHMYVDFRGIQDPYMKAKGSDYFINSRTATLSNRAFCIRNPNGYEGYGENQWGLTACDGPKDTVAVIAGKERQFRGYFARGAAAMEQPDDGTIAPTAAGGSIPFAPEVCLPALEYMWATHYDKLVGPYGFKDAFNLTFPGGWYDKDYLGIDQGPFVIQIQNHKDGLIWDLMKKSPYIREGLSKAGFAGGWLEK